MALNKAIITVVEADTTLALEAAWLLLTDTVKESHIAKASVYIQTVWECTDIDWSDDSTIPEEVKEACAYFALADSNGNLYADPKDEVTGKGLISEETDKVGSLASTVKYCCDKGVVDNYDLLQYPNALMGVWCNASSGTGSVKLQRC
jgi:hypothetical protein